MQRVDAHAAISLIRSELERARRPCVTVSFQAGGVVLLDLLRAVLPDIPVLFIDTLHHFPQTWTYGNELTDRWKLNLITVRTPDPSPGLWRSSTEDCCARHKVEPLFAALEAYDVWFTALRREQSSSRADLREVDMFQLPSGTALRKVNPLVAWTMDDVRAYAASREIPLLPLYASGYLSIGCEPCTSVPSDPSRPRTGRWGGQKLECGIHVGTRGRPTAACGKG